MVVPVELMSTFTSRIAVAAADSFVEEDVTRWRNQMRFQQPILDFSLW